MAQHNGDELKRLFGARLAYIREGKGLSQESLAIQLGRDQSSVSRIESGARDASLAYLLEWCEALGVSFPEVASDLEGIWRGARNEVTGAPDAP